LLSGFCREELGLRKHLRVKNVNWLLHGRNGLSEEKSERYKCLACAAWKNWAL
jgi:hypothetical protein